MSALVFTVDLPRMSEFADRLGVTKPATFVQVDATGRKEGQVLDRLQGRCGHRRMRNVAAIGSNRSGTTPAR